MKTEVQTAKTSERAMKTVVQVAAHAQCNENNGRYCQNRRKRHENKLKTVVQIAETPQNVMKTKAQT